MEGLGSLLLFAVLFYIMMRFGCGAHMIHGGHGGHEDAVNHVDPVCGMKVDPDQGYGKMYLGRLFRFCSRECLEKFDKEPEQYLNTREDKP